MPPSEILEKCKARKPTSAPHEHAGETEWPQQVLILVGAALGVSKVLAKDHGKPMDCPYSPTDFQRTMNAGSRVGKSYPNASGKS